MYEYFFTIYKVFQCRMRHYCDFLFFVFNKLSQKIRSGETTGAKQINLKIMHKQSAKENYELIF